MTCPYCGQTTVAPEDAPLMEACGPCKRMERKYGPGWMDVAERVPSGSVGLTDSIPLPGVGDISWD